MNNKDSASSIEAIVTTILEVRMNWNFYIHASDNNHGIHIIYDTVRNNYYLVYKNNKCNNINPNNDDTDRGSYDWYHNTIWCGNNNNNNNTDCDRVCAKITNPTVDTVVDSTDLVVDSTDLASSKKNFKSRVESIPGAQLAPSENNFKSRIDSISGI